MKFVHWIQSLFTHRGHALADYRSGMKKANKKDYHGAIAEYTSAIENGDTPDDVRAMAIYNRALAYSAIQEDKKAADDLEAVLKQPGLSSRVKTAVLRRQGRLRQRAERDEH